MHRNGGLRMGPARNRGPTFEVCGCLLLRAQQRSMGWRAVLLFALAPRSFLSRILRRKARAGVYQRSRPGVSSLRQCRRCILWYFTSLSTPRGCGTGIRSLAFGSSRRHSLRLRFLVVVTANYSTSGQRKQVEKVEEEKTDGSLRRDFLSCGDMLSRLH